MQTFRLRLVNYDTMQAEGGYRRFRGTYCLQVQGKSEPNATGAGYIQDKAHNLRTEANSGHCRLGASKMATGVRLAKGNRRTVKC